MTSPEVERAVLSKFAKRKVGREALESSSAALQTAAIPSQLPALVVSIWTRKNPMPFCDTGFGYPLGLDRVSQARTWRGQRIRRLIGDTTFACSFGYETRR